VDTARSRRPFCLRPVGDARIREAHPIGGMRIAVFQEDAEE